MSSFSSSWVANLTLISFVFSSLGRWAINEQKGRAGNYLLLSLSHLAHTQHTKADKDHVDATMLLSLL